MLRGALPGRRSSTARSLPAAALLGVALLSSACGGPPASRGDGPAPGACQGSQLLAHVYVGGGGGGGPGRGSVMLTNTSQQTCTLDGYPSVSVFDGAGTQVATARRGCLYPACGGFEQSLVDLAPQRRALFYFDWRDTPENGPECASVKWMSVTPPASHQGLAVLMDLDLCGDPPALGVSPVASGS